MDTEKKHELLSALLDDELQGAERSEAQKFADSDPKLVDDLRDLRKKIRDSKPLEVSADFGVRLLAKLQELPAESSDSAQTLQIVEQPAFPKGVQKFPLLHTITTAVAAAAAVAVTFFALQSTSTSSSTPLRSEQNVVIEQAELVDHSVGGKEKSVPTPVIKVQPVVDVEGLNFSRVSFRSDALEVKRVDSSRRSATDSSADPKSVFTSLVHDMGVWLMRHPEMTGDLDPDAYLKQMLQEVAGEVDVDAYIAYWQKLMDESEN